MKERKPPQRPPWLRVYEGGKSDAEGGEEKVPEYAPVELQELALRLVHVIDNAPADWEQNIDIEMLNDRKNTVSEWEQEKVYAFLGRSDLWQRPNLARALIERAVEIVDPENIISPD